MLSRFNFFYLFFIIFSISNSQILSHKIINESNVEQDIIIDALVELEKSKVKDVKLYYKSENQINYLEQSMIYKGNGFYYGLIPANYVLNKKM